MLRRLGLAAAVGRPLSEISIASLSTVSTESLKPIKRRRRIREKQRDPAGSGSDGVGGSGGCSAAAPAGSAAAEVEGEEAAEATTPTRPLQPRTPARAEEARTEEGETRPTSFASVTLRPTTPTQARWRSGAASIAAARVLRDCGELFCPALLDWEDWLPAIAISRSAMSATHIQRARVSHQMERRLRHRGVYLRRRLPMPAVLDVLACALGRWRSLVTHRAFVLVEDLVVEVVFVDALLSISLAVSKAVPASKVSSVRAELRSWHDPQEVGQIVAIMTQV